MIAPPSSQQPIRPHVESNEDSDSDWDEDDDFVAKKINIRIKPVAELASSEKISASADELRASMGTWKSMANINLVKPNSRRSLHQSTFVLSKLPTDSNYGLAKHQSTHDIEQDIMKPTYSTVAQESLPNEPPMFTQSHGLLEPKAVALAPLVVSQERPVHSRLPVAIATQECLHVRISSTGDVQSTLVGHIKMAVPINIINMSPEPFRNDDLVMQISSSKKWSLIRENRTFLRRIPQLQESGDGSFNSTICLDMAAVHEHATCNIHNASRPYLLLPELATYRLQSQVSPQQEVNDENSSAQAPQNISPLRATTHWLCDAGTTKVRTDIEFFSESLQLPAGVQPRDIRDIVVSMQVSGNVVSQQSKPQASWDPTHSRLFWSFASLQELLEVSTSYGVASCLAKLVLTDGPSRPSETSLQFAIPGKTITNVQLSLLREGNHHVTYELAKHKREIRTGTFECEPQV